MFKNVKHVEIGFNHLENPVQTVHLPESLETLILESNEITSLDILDSLHAPKYPLPPPPRRPFPAASTLFFFSGV